MNIESSKILWEVKIIQPEIFYDFRGTYVETFNEEKYSILTDFDGKPLRFIQDDVSISRQNVFRGLHGDSKTWKLIQCLKGEILLIVADMRKDSPNYKKHEKFTINDSNKLQILVPAGFVNGHLCLSEFCVFSYKQTEYYSGKGKQITIRWNDLDIYLPIVPILSERDALGDSNK